MLCSNWRLERPSNPFSIDHLSWNFLPCNTRLEGCYKRHELTFNANTNALKYLNTFTSIPVYLLNSFSSYLWFSKLKYLMALLIDEVFTVIVYLFYAIFIFFHHMFLFSFGCNNSLGGKPIEIFWNHQQQVDGRWNALGSRCRTEKRLNI